MACVIAAPTSGSGKTLLSLLLASWARCNGQSLQTFKTGPDYLDPQQLTAVSKRPCRNLDIKLCGNNWVKDSFHGFGGSADLALVEGVMGLFDGVGSSTEGSTANLARFLKLPIVLIIDARGQAASLAALVKGFRDHDSSIELAGVVLNQVSTKRHKDLLIEVLNGINVQILGCLFKNPELNLSSRYLGLAPAHEIKNLNTKIHLWAKIAKSNLDLEKFEQLLQAPTPSKTPIEKIINNREKSHELKKFPIAIAQDKAFHFRYPETKEFLEAFGMPCINWKPLENEKIPFEAKGLIIPGGFPEQYAKEISNSDISRKELWRFIRKHPIYAECGGMLFLGNSITDLNGETYPMSGLLPFNAREGKLVVGYREIEAINNNPILTKGDRLIGHEFHKWEVINANSIYLIDKKRHSGNSSLNKEYKPSWNLKGWKIEQREEGWSSKFLHASWVHLHWPSQPKILTRWRKTIESSIENS